MPDVRQMSAAPASIPSKSIFGCLPADNREAKVPDQGQREPDGWSGPDDVRHGDEQQ
jgi:hypothetical protein